MPSKRLIATGTVALLLVVSGCASFSGPTDSRPANTAEPKTGTTTPAPDLIESQPDQSLPALVVTPTLESDIATNATVLNANATAIQNSEILLEGLRKQSQAGGRVRVQMTSKSERQFKHVRQTVSETSEKGGLYVRYDGGIYHVYLVYNF